MNETQTGPSSKPNTILKVLTIAVTLSLVLLPVMFSNGFGPERAQWQAARAIKLYQSGDKQGGIELLTEAVAESDDPQLRLQLVQWQIESQEYEQAMAACDSILKQFRVMGEPNGPAEVQLDRSSALFVLNASRLKADCLILLNRRRQAMDQVLDMERFYDGDNENRIERMNELAYYRAVCGEGLGQAEREIGSVVKEMEIQTDLGPFSFMSQVCYALGLVARYTDQREMAIEPITERIEFLENEHAKMLSNTNVGLYQLMKRFVPLDAKLYSETNAGRVGLEGIVREIAILRAVKALLLEELGQDQAASDERHRVASLNHDAESLLKELPDDRLCRTILSAGATFLDTQGFVQAQRGENVVGLRIMDLAVAASEVSLASMDTTLQNSAVPEIHWTREMALKTCAVCHNHRMLIYKAQSRDDLVAQERKKIVELGFEPGNDLF